MPLVVRDKAELVDRYLYFFMYALTAGFVVGLMLRSNIRATRVGLRLEHLGSNVATGIVVGALLVLTQGLANRFLTKSGQPKTTDRFQRGSGELWVLVFLAAAFAEEFWIAFCVVSMRAAGYPETICVAVTASVFGAAHLAYRVSGALSVSARGVVSALLFLWLGSLMPMVLFHFIGDLGNLYWLRRSARAG